MKICDFELRIRHWDPYHEIVIGDDDNENTSQEEAAKRNEQRTEELKALTKMLVQEQVMAAKEWECPKAYHVLRDVYLMLRSVHCVKDFNSWDDKDACNIRTLTNGLDEFESQSNVDENHEMIINEIDRITNNFDSMILDEVVTYIAEEGVHSKDIDDFGLVLEDMGEEFYDKEKDIVDSVYKGRVCCKWPEQDKKYFDAKAGDFLCELRCTRDYSQEKMAELLDVNRSTISRWEHNKLRVPKEKLIRAIKFLY